MHPITDWKIIFIDEPLKTKAAESETPQPSEDTLAASIPSSEQEEETEPSKIEVTEEQSDDIEDDSIGKDVTTAVVTALRNELKKKEYQRDYLKFKYKGEVCDGVPMAEINPSRFVFKINDKLVAIQLGEIKIL